VGFELVLKRVSMVFPSCETPLEHRGPAILDFRMQILDLKAQNLGGNNACGPNLQSTI
jgi:hypothetical protein